jgi:SRSO17 transposase
MAWNEAQWERNAQRLPKFLSPRVQDLGRCERRGGGATLYVEGLLMPGQRKSIGPMAERLGVDSQKLQQFITDSPWEESAIGKAIRPLAADGLEPLDRGRDRLAQARRTLGGRGASILRSRGQVS